MVQFECNHQLANFEIHSFLAKMTRTFFSLLQHIHLPLEPFWCVFPSICTDFQSRTRPSWVKKKPWTNQNRNWSPFESMSGGHLKLPSAAAGGFSGQKTSEQGRGPCGILGKQLVHQRSSSNSWLILPAPVITLAKLQMMMVGRVLISMETKSNCSLLL